jgi:formylglycine-generating enzyme required for sulfatase activity
VNRVLRGGNFSFGPERARAAYRGFSAQTSRFNMFGFRVARSLAP